MKGALATERQWRNVNTEWKSLRYAVGRRVIQITSLPETRLDISCSQAGIGTFVT
jgi:hypothetical protein